MFPSILRFCLDKYILILLLTYDSFSSVNPGNSIADIVYSKLAFQQAPEICEVIEFKWSLGFTPAPPVLADLYKNQ